MTILSTSQPSTSLQLRISRLATPSSIACGTSSRKAILSSGDGAEPSSAFHVIDIEHEYEVLNRLGLQIEADSLVNDNVEYLKVRENAEGEKGFYFNFGACRNIYRKKYE